jgi:hypothetical protein
MGREVAWAAGLFEGEGTIGVRKTPGCQVYISLTSTDEDVVREFARVVDAGKVYGPYQYDEKRKPFWKWNCDGMNGVRVLEDLLPWFLSRRAARAREVIAAWRTRQGEPHYTVSRKGMGGSKYHNGVRVK